VFNEDAPTNSVGTGGEVSLPPDSEPGVRKKRKKDALLAIKKMLTRKFPVTEAANFGFKVELPHLGEVIVYGQSEAEIRKVLRRYIRPPYIDKDVKISRVYPTGIIKHYTDKRNDAIRGRKDVKMPNYAQAISQDLKLKEEVETMNSKEFVKKQKELLKQSIRRRIKAEKSDNSHKCDCE